MILRDELNEFLHNNLNISLLEARDRILWLRLENVSQKPQVFGGLLDHGSAILISRLTHWWVK